MRFEGTIIITDPCYITTDKDWDNNYCLNQNYFKHNICKDTGVGDGCWNIGNYGQYAADAGMTCVCYLEDYLKYLKDNPSLDDDCKEINNKHGVTSTLDRLVKFGCAVIIKDFKGEILYNYSVGELYLVFIPDNDIKNTFTNHDYLTK